MTKLFPALIIVFFSLLVLVPTFSSFTHAQNSLPISNATNGVGGLLVYVGYAEDKESNVPNAASFPTPWLVSPNTLFLGNPVFGTTNCGTLPSCYDAGAIRLDNPTTNPIVVSNVNVDLHSTLAGGKLFKNLWGTFTVLAGQSVILTQNPPNNNPSYINFDTSGYPKNTNCSAPITAVPTISLTINGSITTLNDSGHVLDTGGVDPGSCKPKQNESIQWQLIGSSATKSASFYLTTTTPTQNLGLPAFVTATLLDGSGYGLPNVAVHFAITTGPNAGYAVDKVTDMTGSANFSYGSSTTGTDTLLTSVTTVGTFAANPLNMQWLPALPPIQLNNLQVNDPNNAKYWSIQTNLQTGLTQYGDRNYLLTNLPANLIGASWLKGSMSTRSITTYLTVSFTLNQAGVVYIAFDSRATLPSWLDRSWQNTGMTLTDSQATGSNLFQLYSKYFPAGVVTLGPNGTGVNPVNMYTVIVK